MGSIFGGMDAGINPRQPAEPMGNSIRRLLNQHLPGQDQQLQGYAPQQQTRSAKDARDDFYRFHWEQRLNKARRRAAPKPLRPDSRARTMTPEELDAIGYSPPTEPFIR